MPIGLRNLDGYLKSRVDGDIGETFYMVDSNFRTAAQGWTRIDNTGPLDLYNERNPGYVFYAPGAGSPSARFATDAAAIQAGVDAMIDFRGDTLYFTPGNYSIATAVLANVPYGRWLGKAYKSPTYGCSPCVRNTTITCAVTNAITMSTANASDGMELAYLRIVPITADESVVIGAAQVNLSWHDFMVDFHGVTESAATAFCGITADGAGNFSLFDQFTWLVDETMGPMFDIGGDLRQTGWTNFLNVIDEAGGAYVTSLLDIATAGDASDGLYVGPGLIMCGAGTASTTFTQLIEAVAMTGANCVGVHGVKNVGAGPAATALQGGTAADFSFVNNYMPTTGGTLFTTS